MAVWHKPRWHRHPAVRTGDALTRGERAADVMKSALATWTALVTVVIVIVGWIATAGFGADGRPFFQLNLFLSCFAALQCFVLLIANRRGEQIASEIAQHTFENTETLRTLLEQNTELTRLVHDHITATA